MIDEFRWGIAIIGAAAIMYIPIFFVKLATMPPRLNTELSKKLNLYEDGTDTISQVIGKLFNLFADVESNQQNYAQILFTNKEDLAIGGISIYPNEFPRRLTEIGENGEWKLEPEPRPYCGMIKRDAMAFFQSLKLENIIEAHRDTRDRDYENYLEVLYLTDFGRQVVNRIAKMNKFKTN